MSQINNRYIEASVPEQNEDLVEVKKTASVNILIGNLQYFG
jgi:hypothetical protein